MSALKIAYIITPIEFGGAERVNLNFLKNVDRSKFQIAPIILTRPWEEDNFFIQELKKIDYPIYKVPVAIRPRSEGRDYFRVIRCYKIIHSILKGNSFDLVHTHGYFADIVGIPVARKLKIPSISTFHGSILTDRNLIIYGMLDRIALKFSNKIIAVSEDIKNYLNKNGIKESSIEVIENAVQTVIDTSTLIHNRQKKRKLLEIKEEEFVVGYIGRLSVEKGIKYLLEAISMLNSDIPVKVLIIGDGPQKRELEDLVKERGCEGRVIFTGFQKDTENWMPVLDVFVLPSLTEGTPMALLEAMACEIPVIASAVGGVPKLIESGKNGILIQPAKPQEIKNALIMLFKNNSLLKSLSNEAQKTIRLKYDIKDWVGKIENEYLKICKRTLI
ncbi:MAG: glycosyltransferase family 4 protein [Nitrospirota bacterium]